MDQPISNLELIYVIRTILKHGIDIGTKNKIAELKFLVDLHRFINNKGKLRSYIEESKITIETLWYDPMVSVEVENGLMYVIPITDEGFYEALSEIIHFITFIETKRRVVDGTPPEKKKKIPDDAFDWI
jgi:hypothetical protein